MFCYIPNRNLQTIQALLQKSNPKQLVQNQMLRRGASCLFVCLALHCLNSSIGEGAYVSQDQL
jgi:hypothetical protein